VAENNPGVHANKTVDIRRKGTKWANKDEQGQVQLTSRRKKPSDEIIREKRPQVQSSRKDD